MNTPTPPPNYRIIPREYLEAGNPLPSDAILLEDDDQWVPSMIQGERTNSTYITYATAQPLPCFAPPPNEQEHASLTPLTGTWRTRCCVCGIEYENGVGSTECCGSVQEIIEKDGKPYPAPSEQPCPQCARLSEENEALNGKLAAAILGGKEEVERLTAELSTARQQLAEAQQELGGSNDVLDSIRIILTKYYGEAMGRVPGGFPSSIENLCKDVSSLTKQLAACEKDAVSKFIDSAEVWELLTVSPIALASAGRGLRALGHDIPQKMEQECGYVLRLALHKIAKHGDKWREAFAAEFDAARQTEASK